MSTSYHVRAKDADGFEFDFLFTAAEFDVVCRAGEAAGPLVEISEQWGIAFKLGGRVALWLKPPASRSWHFFDYEQFRKAAALVVVAESMDRAI